MAAATKSRTGPDASACRDTQLPMSLCQGLAEHLDNRGWRPRADLEGKLSRTLYAIHRKSLAPNWHPGKLMFAKVFQNTAATAEAKSLRDVMPSAKLVSECIPRKVS